MDINFNEIPFDLRTPGIFAEISPAANPNVGAFPDRILIIGQVLAGSTATPGEAVRSFGIGQSQQLAGRGSMLAAMAAVVHAVAPTTEVTLLPLADNGAGTAATGSIEVTAAPTAAGTLAVYVGGRRYSITVAAGDATTVVATAIADAISADPDALATAAVTASTVDLTARHAGVAAGTLDIRHSYYAAEALPAGLALAITAFDGGAGEPALAAALAGLGDTYYPTVVNPYTEAGQLADLEADLDDRFTAMRAIAAMAFGAAIGSVSELATFGNSRNNPHASFIDAAGSPTPAFLWAANVAAEEAQQIQRDPGLSMQTVPLTQVLAPAVADRRTWQERDALLQNGIATHKTGPDGVVRIDRLVTTYETDQFGNDDVRYLDVVQLRLYAAFRITAVAYMQQFFSRKKLGQAGSTGPNVVTPATILTAGVAIYTTIWLARGWVEGGAAFTQFKAEQRAVIDASDPNRVNWILPPNTINQLRVLAAKVTPSL